MAFEKIDGQVSVWKKQARNGSEYLQGSVQIDGIEYRLVLFEKQKTRDTQPDYTGKLEPADAGKAYVKDAPQTSQGSPDDAGSDTPF